MDSDWPQTFFFTYATYFLAPVKFMLHYYCSVAWGSFVLLQPPSCLLLKFSCISTRGWEAQAQAEASCAAPELLLHGRQVSRMLQDLQPSSDRRPLSRQLHSPGSTTHQRTCKAHIRQLVSKETAQKQSRCWNNNALILTRPYWRNTSSVINVKAI